MSTDPFGIGLVGAGAISAGAYTAGVIDFLVYALDQWYEAKSNNSEEVPPHDVKISVFSGASAGAMTAALATAYLASDQPSVKNEEDGRSNNGRNKLFDSWVDRIDIKNLLESRDLDDRDSSVCSLLDSSVLLEIAESGLDVNTRQKRRPYIDENFELILTVTNLRGVPYEFQVMGSEPENYEMLLHADYVHFRISDSQQNWLNDRYSMDWKDFDKGSPSANKEILKKAAIASGAFPIFLAPHTLSHVISKNKDYYSARKWMIPTPHTHDPHQCMTPNCIPANWGGINQNCGYQYEFQCVDGGIMDNEPLELARRILAGDKLRNDRNGQHADKAVLLIDPFPNQVSFDSNYLSNSSGLLGIAINVLKALKNQSRFKPDELKLAADEEVCSRFMIAPSRNGETYPIACAALGGFGGFFKKEFRVHDYFLGRRNAQQFLKNYFVLPENNPLFSGWNLDMRENYYVLDSSGHPRRGKDNQRLLPIIPLVNEAKHPCDNPEWPQKYTSEDLANLIKQIGTRADIVCNRLAKQYLGKSCFPIQLIGQYVVKLIFFLKKKDIMESIRNKISCDFKKMQLMKK